MAEDLTVGAVIAGRYRLERLLAEGGMGVVWAAKHLVTRKPVALKFVKGEAANDERTRRRLLREARAACAVQHPNVVAVHDVMELESGSPVLVMDLLKGESLRAKLDRQGKIPLHDLANILIPVVSAVGTAHSSGVVHRDLKPENIFLAQMPGGVVQVKVLDFGIAKLTSTEGLMGQSGALTGTGLLLGTPDYMSVEQILGEEDVDHRADIWALGIVLYECLRGQRPTAADNVGKVLKIILTNAIPPIQLVMPALPDDIKNLIMRMISLDRAGRPPNMLEVGRILERYGTVPLLPFDAPRARAVSELPPGPSTSLPSTKVGVPRILSDSGSRTLVGGTPADQKASMELADTTAVRPPSSSRPLAERPIRVSPALLGRDLGDAGMPIALDEPFAMDSIASDRQLTMSNKGLTLGDLLSPDELAMLGERLERAQSDAPEARDSAPPDSSGEPPISVSEFLPPSVGHLPPPPSMGPVSSEDPVTLVAGRVLAPAELRQPGAAADLDARALGETLPLPARSEEKPTLPFTPPRDLRGQIPPSQPVSPSTPRPSRLSFSDPGGSRDFPPRLFPTGPTFDGLPSRGPSTTRSTEVQTPNTTTAPAPASSPMPASRSALRYLMIGGLSCGAVAAVWLLMKPLPRHVDDGNTGPARTASTPPGVPPTSRGCPPGMILIPGDTFAMGAAEGYPDERPVHDVKVETFCMDLTEVTGADYQRCVDQNHCEPPAKTVTAATTGKGPMTSADRAFEGGLCQDPKRDGAKNLPINCVNWTDANTYCRVQGKRLPTEEEWEFSARGGAELRLFPWGTAPPSPKLVNACGGECADLYERLAKKKKKSTLFDESDGQPALAPVGSFPAGDTRFGNHDMAGNVWEWTASALCTYPSHSCSNPNRVFRGGSFASSGAASFTGTTRMAGAPESRYMDVGFRCAKDKG